MCPKQQQNANCIQVEIEKFIMRGRNLPRTNSTKSETQNIFAKKQENEHTPGPWGNFFLFLSGFQNTGQNIGFAPQILNLFTYHALYTVSDILYAPQDLTNFCLKVTISVNSVFGLQYKSMGISLFQYCRLY